MTCQEVPRKVAGQTERLVARLRRRQLQLARGGRFVESARYAGLVRRVASREGCGSRP